MSGAPNSRRRAATHSIAAVVMSHAPARALIIQAEVRHHGDRCDGQPEVMRNNMRIAMVVIMMTIMNFRNNGDHPVHQQCHYRDEHHEIMIITMTIFMVISILTIM